MPRGDEKHKLIYDELVNILGPEWVEDDPAVMEAFYRDGNTPSTASKSRAEFIVLPGSTEDVQQILRLANRYKFPWSITSTGLFLLTCNAVEGYSYWCFIDPKRLNRLIKIDADNMYYIAEPYVTIAQVQAETMKRGLFCGVPGASCQSSAVAGNLFQAMRWTGWRVGVGKDILGVEWVLPSGDIMRTGSLATGEEWCWGEGPGPDARGILRGQVGHLGSLGVVTKMAIKLYRWAGPPVYPTEGIQPEKKAPLPPEMIKSYFINFPSLEKAIDAIAEMGKAEIAGLVMKFAPWDCVCWSTKSMEEFWRVWESDFWMQMKKNGHIVWVELWRYASDKQMKYEEKVLKQIMEEYGGELLPDQWCQQLDACLTPNSVRDTHRLRFGRLARIGLAGTTMDSLYDVLRSVKTDIKIKEKYTPPYGYMGNDIKFWPFDFGRLAWTEIDTTAEKTTECEDLIQNQITPDMVKALVEEKSAPAFVSMVPINIVGPLYGNVHLIFGSIKKALDPNNVAQPTRIIDMKAMEAGTAPGEVKMPI